MGPPQALPHPLLAFQDIEHLFDIEGTHVSRNQPILSVDLLLYPPSSELFLCLLADSNIEELMYKTSKIERWLKDKQITHANC